MAGTWIPPVIKKAFKQKNESDILNMGISDLKASLNL